LAPFEVLAEILTNFNVFGLDHINNLKFWQISEKQVFRFKKQNYLLKTQNFMIHIKTE
jgi:hypothetical protein